MIVLSKQLKTALIFLFLFSALGGIFFGFFVAEIINCSKVNDLKKFQPSIPSRLYDKNDELIAEFFAQKRDLVSFENLPQTLIKSFLAAEDRNFYDHFGINPIAIFRAMVKNIKASLKANRIVIVQGGSTITQQLAKRIFTKSERTLTRKILEASLALQIERKFSKDKILELYFNQIYLGHGCHGVAAAAEFFFNKDVRYLSLMESSVLAALPSKPNGLSPLKHPHKAFAKNKDTIRRLIEAGFIPEKKALEMFDFFWPDFINSLKLKSPTKTVYSKNIDHAPYFTSYVRQILLARFGQEALYNNGLKIYTTLDLNKHRLAQKYLSEGLKNQNEISTKANESYGEQIDYNLISSFNNLRTVFSLPNILVKKDVETQFKKLMVDELIDSIDGLSLLIGSPKINKAITRFRSLVTTISTSLKVEGALISIEPSTGYITSMVGGSEFNSSNQYNRATQARRQPGSAFKPFVYGAAFESKKINAATTLPDAPIANLNSRGEAWSPGNYGGSFSGLVRIRKALAKSINIISVRLYDLLGPDKIIDFASRIIKISEFRFSPNPSLSLGSVELTPFELASAYAIYANQGKEVIPFPIRYILNSQGEEILNIEEEVNRILALKKEQGSLQIIPEEVAFMMTSLMQDVINEGTAHEAVQAQGHFKNEAAGKTGTTSNWTDAWFCGFTPNLATVVWVGYDQPFMSLGKHQSGSSVAAPIWANYMRESHKDLKPLTFPDPPENIYKQNVCKYSGLIPTEDCEETISEFMIKDSGPTKFCDGQHYTMKSIFDLYLEKENLKVMEDKDKEIKQKED